MSERTAPAVRLTRRGRLTITLAVMTLMVASIAFVTGRDSEAIPAPAEPSAPAVATPTLQAEPARPRPTPVPERTVSRSGSGDLVVVGGSAGWAHKDLKVFRGIDAELSNPAISGRPVERLAGSRADTGMRVDPLGAGCLD